MPQISSAEGSSTRNCGGTSNQSEAGRARPSSTCTRGSRCTASRPDIARHSVALPSSSLHTRCHLRQACNHWSEGCFHAPEVTFQSREVTFHPREGAFRPPEVTFHAR